MWLRTFWCSPYIVMGTVTNKMGFRWLVESVETSDADKILVWNNKVTRHCFGEFCIGVIRDVAQ